MIVLVSVPNVMMASVPDSAVALALSPRAVSAVPPVMASFAALPSRVVASSSLPSLLKPALSDPPEAAVTSSARAEREYVPPPSVMVCVLTVVPSVAIAMVEPAATVIELPSALLRSIAPAEDCVTVKVWLPTARSTEDVSWETPRADEADTR